MKKYRAVPVHSPCAKCGARGRLWEVHGHPTWHTFCFACRMHREWNESTGSKFSKLSRGEAAKREARYKEGLKK